MTERAIVFDLETLYPYRMFVRSGGRAVAERLAGECGVRAAEMAMVVQEVLAEGDRGRELQGLCARLALPTTLVTALEVDAPSHLRRPDVRVTVDTAEDLALIRRLSSRLGQPTDEPPLLSIIAAADRRNGELKAACPRAGGER